MANHNMNNPIHSHAAILQQDQFPKRDQAIILPSHDDTKLEDYLLAVGDIIQSKIS